MSSTPPESWAAQAPQTVLVPVSAQGLLRELAAAGVLSLAAVHVAQTTCRLVGESDPRVQLAAALAVRALEAGSVSLDLTSIEAEVSGSLAERSDGAADTGDRPVIQPIAWPEQQQWLDALAHSPAVATEHEPPNRRPLRLVDGLLYLERYWGHELSVRTILDRRAGLARAHVQSPAQIAPASQSTRQGAEQIARSSYTADQVPDARQIEAAVRAASEPTLVLAGGPGTGKTATVARMIATAQAMTDRQLMVALAAPSGKAAARLATAVHEALASFPDPWPHPLPLVDPAFTVHRLLESRGPLKGFAKGAQNRLAHDIVVVDETSMLSLPLAAQLLSAVRDDAKLILVGDPMQLTSVEAGSVLADLTVSARAGSPRVGLVELTHNWRSSGTVAQLADAIRAGNAPATLEVLRAGDPAVRFIETDHAVGLTDLPALRSDLADLLAQIEHAARAGDAELALALWDRHRLLCAHRSGPFGVAWWARQVDQLQRGLELRAPRTEWYPGRGVLVTRNAAELGLRNGDTGVVVSTQDGVRVAFAQPDRPARLLPPWVLDEVETLHAMTVHKAQGSQFEQVTVVLPPSASPLLTREMVYTAITRTQSALTVIGSADAIEKAINTPAARISGLARGW